MNKLPGVVSGFVEDGRLFRHKYKPDHVDGQYLSWRQRCRECCGYHQDRQRYASSTSRQSASPPGFESRAGRSVDSRRRYVAAGAAFHHCRSDFRPCCEFSSLMSTTNTEHPEAAFEDGSVGQPNVSKPAASTNQVAATYDASGDPTGSGHLPHRGSGRTGGRTSSSVGGSGMRRPRNKSTESRTTSRSDSSAGGGSGLRRGNRGTMLLGQIADETDIHPTDLVSE